MRSPEPQRRRRPGQRGVGRRERHRSPLPSLRTLTRGRPRPHRGDHAVRSALFRADEIPVALEVFDAAVAGSPDYLALGAEARRAPGRLDLLGPTPCTLGTYDLYWIAVDPALHGGGVGTAAPGRDGAAAGRRRPADRRGDRRPARLRAHPRLLRGARIPGRVAAIPDFYAPGDDQVVYVKSSHAAAAVEPLRRTGSDHGDLAGSPQNELDQVARGARGQVRPGALPRPRPPAAGGRELRVPDLAGDGRPDQVARRPDLAAVRPDGRGARHRRRRRRLARRGRATRPVPNITHRYPDRALFLVSPGLRQLLPVLHPAAEGGRSREDPDVAVRVGVPVPRAAHRDPRRHHVAAAIRCCSTTGGSRPSSRGCGPSRTSRSSGSGAGSRPTCPSGSRPSSATC